MIGHVATADIEIDAPAALVWAALTDPDQIAKYMFGAKVETDWRPGSVITWSGEYQGRAYQDKGEIVEVEPERLLKVTHFSPLTGQEDKPENYHTVVYELEPRGDKTRVVLRQDNNASADEAAHSAANWKVFLAGLKDVVEPGDNGKRSAGG